MPLRRAGTVPSAGVRLRPPAQQRTASQVLRAALRPGHGAVRIYLLSRLTVASARHIISGMTSRFTFVPYLGFRPCPPPRHAGRARRGARPAIIEQRPRGSPPPRIPTWRWQKVRNLIERTGLTYSEIAKKDRRRPRQASAAGARDGKWLRPGRTPPCAHRPGAEPARRPPVEDANARHPARDARPSDTCASWRPAPEVDPDRLMQALQLVKMTRLEAMGRRRRRRFYSEPRTGGVGAVARPGDPHRAERNAPRRRRYRPRAEGGGWSW